jgi:hypothetical protein
MGSCEVAATAQLSGRYLSYAKRIGKRPSDLWESVGTVALVMQGNETATVIVPADKVCV